MIVYISIGNSDDKLTQKQWSIFCIAVDLILRSTTHIHGEWYSRSSSQYQNACWCVEFDPHAQVIAHEDADTLETQDYLVRRLRQLARRFEQNSIAWAEVPVPKFLIPE